MFTFWTQTISFEMIITGIGLSFINGLHEELIYARFQGIVLHVNHQGPTYQITGSVEMIQVRFIFKLAVTVLN